MSKEIKTGEEEKAIRTELLKSFEERIKTLEPPYMKSVTTTEKSQELQDMEKIVRRTFEKIAMYNPYINTSYSADLLNKLIQSESELYLDVFGLDICKTVSLQILRHDISMNSRSVLSDFAELCKSRKRSMETMNNTTSMISSLKVDTAAQKKPPGFLKDFLKSIYLNKGL